MGLPRLLFVTACVAAAILGICRTAWTQSPTYGVGGTPSPEQIRGWDISIGPTGKELPVGEGTAKEGGAIFAKKCAACHGVTGSGGHAPTLIVSKDSQKSSVPCLNPCVNDRNAMAIHSPYATTMWDYIHRAMPLGQEGSLTANEVYSLTAFILFKNDVIKEDEAMNAQSLPKVQMPNREGYALPPAWEHGKPRLQGYP